MRNHIWIPSRPFQRILESFYLTLTHFKTYFLFIIVDHDLNLIINSAKLCTLASDQTLSALFNHPYLTNEPSAALPCCYCWCSAPLRSHSAESDPLNQVSWTSYWAQLLSYLWSDPPRPRALGENSIQNTILRTNDAFVVFSALYCFTCFLTSDKDKESQTILDQVQNRLTQK